MSRKLSRQKCPRVQWDFIDKSDYADTDGEERSIFQKIHLGSRQMLVQTTRFGQIDAQQEQVIVFPQGLIGFEACRHWLIVADPQNSDVAWLQSLSQMQVALPMVSPRKFAPDYRVTIPRRQLALLNLRSSDRVYVMAVVSKSGKTLTANLRSPIVINLTKCIAVQVITSDAQPLALPLSLSNSPALRMAA